MRKLILAATVSLVALAAAAGSASAYTATVEGPGEITGVSLGRLSFRGGFFTIACPVALEGYLNEGPIEITAGRTIGAITGVEIDNDECSGGRVGGVLFTEAEEFEWDINLSDTTHGGTLPNAATEVRFDIIGSKFLLSVFEEAVNCLYAGDADDNRVEVDGTNPYDTDLVIANASGIPKFSGGGLCPSSGSFSGTLSLTEHNIIVEE